MQRLLTFLIALVACALWIGLAILGSGGLGPFFSHPALVAVVAIVLAAVVAAMFTSGNLSSGEREDRGNRWVLAAFGIVGLLDGWLPAYTDRRDLWTIDGDATRWVGVALFAIGCWVRIWPVFVLGRRFSGLVAIQPGHQLVTDGPYRWVRNPSYVGLLISVLGWGLAFRAWAGVILAALMLPPLIARIRSEERMLASQFGPAWNAYRARTWRLAPGVW